jgi:hypothetical protein
MVLHLPELLGLFFEFIEFFESFGLDLFKRVEPAGGDVNSLVNLRVFLASTKHFQFFEVRFLEHYINLLS